MNDFLAHEVRNPLSVAVSGLRFVEGAVGDEVSPSVRDDLAMVRESLAYIDELMTQMLDLNKFLEGKRPSRASSFSR